MPELIEYRVVGKMTQQGEVYYCDGGDCLGHDLCDRYKRIDLRVFVEHSDEAIDTAYEQEEHIHPRYILPSSYMVWRWHGVPSVMVYGEDQWMRDAGNAPLFNLVQA